MSLDMFFKEVFQSSIEEYEFNCAISCIDNGEFKNFQRMVKEGTFNADTRNNALLHYASKSGQFQFVKELLKYPTVVLTLSRMPEIIFNDSLANEIVDLMIDALQRDFVFGHNPQFLNWLLLNEKHELAIRFKQGAEVKYEYKPDLVEVEMMHDAELHLFSFKRKREEESWHYCPQFPLEKKRRHHEPEESVELLSCAQDDSEFQKILNEVVIIESWDESNWSLVDSSLKNKFFQYLNALTRKQFNLNELPQLNELLDYLNSSIIVRKISPNERTLDLERLSLTRFPVSLLAAPYYFEYWMALERLILSGNCLSTLPKAIGNLRNLRFLYLDQNALITIPSEIAQLSELRVLDLRRNRLNYIFDEIGCLEKLEYLNISDNELQAVPDLSSLIHLKVLEAAHNHLTTLPSELAELKELEWMDIKFNKLNENEIFHLSKKFKPEWYNEMISSQSESSLRNYRM